MNGLLHNLDKDYEKCLQWEKSNLYGELLKGKSEFIKTEYPIRVKVLNYYTNEEVEIPLDVKIITAGKYGAVFQEGKETAPWFGSRRAEQRIAR